MEAVHLTEKESETSPEFVARGCEGGQTFPGATEGHMCLFQASGPGGTEPLWKSAKFVEFVNVDHINTTGTGLLGVRVVYRATGFVATGKGSTPVGGSFLTAGGGWAVTSK
jgi:hypothetical protein